MTRDCELVAATRDRDLTQESEGALLMAVLGLKPELGNAIIARLFSHMPESNGLSDAALVHVLESLSRSVSEGDMSQIEAVLVSQIVSLNAIFAHSAALAKTSSGADRSASLMNLALKAQGNCRATIQALTDLKFPRAPSVFAKQANFAAGAQQVNNGVSGSLPPSKSSESQGALPYSPSPALDVPAQTGTNAHARARTRKSTEQTKRRTR